MCLCVFSEDIFAPTHVAWLLASWQGNSDGPALICDSLLRLVCVPSSWCLCSVCVCVREGWRSSLICQMRRVTQRTADRWVGEREERHEAITSELGEREVQLMVFDVVSALPGEPLRRTLVGQTHPASWSATHSLVFLCLISQQFFHATLRSLEIVMSLLIAQLYQHQTFQNSNSFTIYLSHCTFMPSRRFPPSYEATLLKAPQTKDTINPT